MATVLPVPAQNSVATRSPSDIPPPNSFSTTLDGYLERVAKGIFTGTKSYLPSSSKKCGTWAKIGQCENGHRYAKRLFCGRPYHEACREITHRKKLARLLPKAQQIMPMGYWVVRPPNKYQYLYRTKKQRSAFTTRVSQALQAIGYSRGIILKHDFGEKSDIYAFHPNVLVDSGYKAPEVLDVEKRQLRRLIYPRWMLREYGDTLDIWYEYRQTRGEIMHTLKYCTKATFLDYQWDPSLADSLYRERYVVSWGNWKQPEKWQLSRHDRYLESLVSLEQKKCPQCGEPLKWSRPCQSFVLVLMEEPVDLGNGYYCLPPIRAPAVLPGEIKGRLDHLDVNHRQVVRASMARAEAQAEIDLAHDRLFWLDLLAAETAESEDCL